MLNDLDVDFPKDDIDLYKIMKNVIEKYPQLLEQLNNDINSRNNNLNQKNRDLQILNNNINRINSLSQSQREKKAVNYRIY